MAKILTVGIATLDIINELASYPAEDSEVRALSQTKSRGGNATNTAVVLSQLGHNCAWAGVLINKPDSAVIKHDLQQHHIDFSSCSQPEQGKMPTSYISLNRQSGSRSIVHYRDCPEFSFNDFQKIDLTPFDWIHFEGRNVTDTLRMLQYVKQYFPTLNCSVEVEKPRDNIEQLFSYADLLLFSHHYAKYHDVNCADDLLASLPHPVLATCTWGQQGAWLMTKDRVSIHCDAFPPDVIKDTLGAGDTFNAGFIHSLLAQKNPQQALHYASQLAGHKCGQRGFSHLLNEFKG